MPETAVVEFMGRLEHGPYRPRPICVEPEAASNI